MNLHHRPSIPLAGLEEIVAVVVGIGLRCGVVDPILRTCRITEITTASDIIDSGMNRLQIVRIYGSKVREIARLGGCNN
jgi:hypothetical protein